MKKKFALIIIVEVTLFFILSISMGIYNGLKNRIFEQYFSNPIYTREVFMVVSDFEDINEDFFNNIINGLDENTQVIFEVTSLIDNKYGKSMYIAKYPKKQLFKFEVKRSDGSRGDTEGVIVGEGLLNENIVEYDYQGNQFIQIRDNKFNIGGYIGDYRINTNFKDIIILPIDLFKRNLLSKELFKEDEIGGVSSMSINAFVSNKGSVDDEVLKIKSNLENFKNITGVYSSDIETNQSFDIKISYKVLIVFAISIFILSITTISFIIIDWIKTQKNIIAIKMSLGLRKRDIFLQVFREISIGSYVSVVIVLFILKFSINIIQSVNSVQVILRWNDLLYLIILATIFSLTASLSVIVVLKNFNIFRNIKNEE